MRESIQAQTDFREGLKDQPKQTPRKVPLKDLPQAERHRQLCPECKHFIDTIKIIAYSAFATFAIALFTESPDS